MSLRRLLEDIERSTKEGADSQEKILERLGNAISKDEYQNLKQEISDLVASQIQESFSKIAESIDASGKSHEDAVKAQSEVISNLPTKDDVDQYFKGAHDKLDKLATQDQIDGLSKELSALASAMEERHGLVIQRFDTQDKNFDRASRRGLRHIITIESKLTAIQGNVLKFQEIEETLRSTGGKFFNLLNWAEEKLEENIDAMAAIAQETENTAGVMNDSIERSRTVANNLEIASKTAKDTVGRYNGLLDILEKTVTTARKEAERLYSTQYENFKDFSNMVALNQEKFINSTRDEFMKRIASVNSEITGSIREIGGLLNQANVQMHDWASSTSDIQGAVLELNKLVMEKKLDAQQVERFLSASAVLQQLTDMTTELKEEIHELNGTLAED